MKDRLKDKVDIELVVVGSEGPITRKLAKESGWTYIQMMNEPVSQKWNAGVRYLKNVAPDATVILGSDDFISDNLILEYKNLIEKNYVLIGVKDMYMLDVPTKRFGRWVGYLPGADTKRVGETIGMARCLSRKIMEMVDYNIWGPIEANSGLDGIMSQRFQELQLKYCSALTCPIHRVNEDTKMYNWGHVGYYLSELKSVGVDIKTSTNITRLDEYIRMNPDCMEWIEDAPGFFKTHLPHLNFNKIMNSDEQI
tara:strand:+ start:5507 stop:6265 length:759 start_codon:yes stop_codon:yes gene_type:complete